MNDAERDAWLREALRHAPDSQALPPRDVSEAILAEARAAARSELAGAARGARAATTNPLTAFWDWLARPPVAVGFASVMAATLVGLMWWDRPLDETLPRRPDVVREGAQAPAPKDAAAPASSAPPLAKDEEKSGATRTLPATAEPRPAQANDAIGAAGETRRQVPAAEGATERDAKVTAPAAAQRKPAVAHDDAARAERKAEGPTPFPTNESDRAAVAPKPSLAAKKDEAGLPAPSADSRMSREEGVGLPSVAAAAAPAAPPAAARAGAQPEPLPPARRRPDSDDGRTSPATGASLDAAKAAPATPMAAAPPAAPGAGLRGALGEAREKQAGAFGSAPLAPAASAARAAPTRNELAAAQRESAAAPAPLAAVLAAIASEPARWSRASAGGSVVALDAGWHDWLARLDAAVAGRWRPLTGTSAAEMEGDGTTTLRLLAPGRPAMLVRLDGRTVRVEDAGDGSRWQATLPADAAERLRAAAALLPP